MEFKTEWPAMRTLEISTEARRETLMSLKVTEEELGKIVADGKCKEYTHVIWADNAEAIWRLLEDNKGLLIHDIRKNLPEGVLNCIPDTRATREDYKAFTGSPGDFNQKSDQTHKDDSKGAHYRRAAAIADTTLANTTFANVIPLEPTYINVDLLYAQLPTLRGTPNTTNPTQQRHI
jgi:hypothetical protein